LKIRQLYHQFKWQFKWEEFAITTSLSYQDQLRQQLQALFDNHSSERLLKLIPQEYPGTLVINRILEIDGQGATLWAFKGPVLQVAAPRLTLKNLNIEVTADTFASSEEECALCVNPNTFIHFENVQVRGQVIGIDGESGQWCYPHSLYLGYLTPNLSHQFLIRIMVPTSCSIESAIYGVELEPTFLEAGMREISLKIEPLHHDTALYGSLYLQTARLKRRIQLTAYSASNAKVAQSSTSLIWMPPSQPSPLSPASQPSPLSPPTIAISNSNPSQRQSAWLTSPVDSITHRHHVSNSVFFSQKCTNHQEKPKQDQQKTDNIFWQSQKTS
jgi:hypothetical protein